MYSYSWMLINKRHKPLIYPKIWIDLKNNVLSEESRTQNSAYCISPFIWNFRIAKLTSGAGMEDIFRGWKHPLGCLDVHWSKVSTLKIWAFHWMWIMPKGKGREEEDGEKEIDFRLLPSVLFSIHELICILASSKLFLKSTLSGFSLYNCSIQSKYLYKVGIEKEKTANKLWL